MQPALIIVTSVEIYCPSESCEGNDPIPAKSGSFIWATDAMPATITCPTCKKTFAIPMKITAEIR